MGDARRRGTFQQRRLEAMARNRPKLAYMQVFRSDGAEGPWEPIHRDDVPEWLRADPVRMGRLAADKSLSCMNPDDAPPRYWYRAEVIEQEHQHTSSGGIILQ